MFQLVEEDLLHIVLEIINSNPQYNILENGIPTRTIVEAKSQILNQNTESYLICLENKYVGIIDSLESNPSDNCPWIGLLMIHGKCHRKGYGKTAYNLFEEKLKQQGYDKVHIGILTDNVGAKRFWTSLGFRFYTYKLWQGRIIECYERQL